MNQLDVKDISRKTLELLCEGICLNSNAHPKIEGNKFEHIGNKTECALLEMSFKFGFDFRKVRTNSDRVRKVIPFSSSRKRMTSVYDY